VRGRLSSESVTTSPQKKDLLLKSKFFGPLLLTEERENLNKAKKCENSLYVWHEIYGVDRPMPRSGCGRFYEIETSKNSNFAGNIQ
jgi:hypothetical protein